MGRQEKSIGHLGLRNSVGTVRPFSPVVPLKVDTIPQVEPSVFRKVYLSEPLAQGNDSMSEQKHTVGLSDAVLSLIVDQSATPNWVSLIQHAYLAGRQLRRILGQATARFQLCDSEFLVLWTCQQATPAGVPQGDLTGLLCLSPAQLSSLVYDLRDRGLVQVERPVEDRRRQLLRTTEAGSQLIREIDAELSVIAIPIDRHFSHEQRRTTSSLLERLIRATAGMRDEALRLGIDSPVAVTVTGGPSFTNGTTGPDSVSESMDAPIRKAA